MRNIYALDQFKEIWEAEVKNLWANFFFFNIISLRCVNADRKVQRILVFGDSADLSSIGQI